MLNRHLVVSSLDGRLVGLDSNWFALPSQQEAKWMIRVSLQDGVKHVELLP
jgi:hypothetical protein